MNPSLAEYHVPVHADVPPIDVSFLDDPDPNAPLGILGAGEVGIVGVGAAVANAVYHATGKRVRDLPITLDKLLCVLTHDAKFDVPLLEAALRLPASYIGAMGSRRTHEDRDRRLRDIGLTDAELTRLHSPIGLDLGARTPEETALSVAAEIVAARHGGTGLPLSDSHTPIHHGRTDRQVNGNTSPALTAGVAVSSTCDHATDRPTSPTSTPGSDSDQVCTGFFFAAICP